MRGLIVTPSGHPDDLCLTDGGAAISSD